MKTARDPRHLKRAKAIQTLYAYSFQSNQVFDDPLAKEVTDHLKKIDNLISLAAPSRPIEQINRIDLSILRLAIFELVVKKTEPFKVVVDEAIELGKEFGSDSSAGFINGALGNLINLKKIK